MADKKVIKKERAKVAKKEPPKVRLKSTYIDKELCIVVCEGREHQFNDPYTAWNFYRTVK